MAKTAAERKKLQRERMRKNGIYQDYLSKQRLLMSKKRRDEKAKVDDMRETIIIDYVKDKKKKERERKATYRLRKGKERQPELQQPSPSKNAFKSTSSKGKALARVKRNLPQSPRKRRAVVKELAFEQVKIKPFTSLKKRRSFLCDPEIKHSIIKFYNRDDISRQSPHARDKVENVE